LGIRWN